MMVELRNTNGADMKISEEGKALIKSFEGCKLESYLCSAGVPTIAWGKTQGVEMGMTCTQEQADQWFDEEIVEYEDYVNELVTAPLEQYQFDALCSWVYNLGPANLQASSLLRELNQGNYDRVPAEIKKWCKATVNGEKVVLPGLERRRTAESMLFQNNGDWHTI